MAYQAWKEVQNVCTKLQQNSTKRGEAAYKEKKKELLNITTESENIQWSDLCHKLNQKSLGDAYKIVSKKWVYRRKWWRGVRERKTKVGGSECPGLIINELRTN